MKDSDREALRAKYASPKEDSLTVGVSDDYSLGHYAGLINRGLLSTAWLDQIPFIDAKLPKAETTTQRALVSGVGAMGMAGVLKKGAKEALGTLASPGGPSAKSTTRLLGEDFVKTAESNKKLFYGSELGGGMGAQYGMEYFGSKDFEHSAGGDIYQEVFGKYANPAKEATGAVGGGVVGGVAATVPLSPGLAMARYTVNKGMNFVSKKLNVDPTGSQSQAQSAIEGRVGEGVGGSLVDKAQKQNITPEVRKQLTLAEQTGDQRLLELEADLLAMYPEMSDAMKNRYSSVARTIKDSLSETINPEDVDPSIVRQHLDTLLELRIQAAKSMLAERTSDLSVGIDKERAESLAKLLVLDAEAAASDQADQLWSNIPELKALNVPTNARNTLFEILSNMTTSRVKKELINNKVPWFLRKHIGNLDKNGDFEPGTLDDLTTVEEIIDLRKQINRARREEWASKVPDREKIAILNKVDDSLLNDLSVLDKTASEEYRIAREYHSDMVKRFRQGDVGEMLGFKITGEQNVPDTMILEGITGKSPRARQRIDSLLVAMERTGNIPEMREYMEEFIKDEFRSIAGHGEDFSVSRAEQWLGNNRDVMARFPELRRKMENAVQTGKYLKDQTELRSPSKSAAAVFLNSPPGTEIAKVLRSKNPKKAMQELLLLVGTDPSKKAFYGTQQAFLEELLRSSRSGLPSSDGVQFISGSKLNSLLKSPAVKDTMPLLLNAKQIKRLRMAAKEFELLESARKKGRSGRNLDLDTSGVFFDTLWRMGAVRIGRLLSAGQGDLHTPSLIQRLGQKLRAQGLEPAKVLLRDAVLSTDDTLMKALLTKTHIESGTNNKQLEKMIREERAAKSVIRAWFLRKAVELGVGNDPEEDDLYDEFTQDIGMY